MPKKVIEALRLPSQHQIGDKVKFYAMPEGYSEFPGLVAYITGVHFYTGKVKYDIELRFAGDFASRIYNVDSVLVLKFEK